MADSPRIAELRRRVHADPASIAFAQLAEEYRRAGNYQDAVKYCRTGLARHPGYLSARVTLGRALIEIGGLDEAAGEFALVLKSAPDNLAAIRGIAEIHQRRGDLAAALDYYKRALELARFDPELEETVNRIGREIGSDASAQHDDVESSDQPAPAGAQLIDFDALLATLGVPNASPPPVVEMLLSPSGPPPEPATVSELTIAPSADDGFAGLEQGLRDFDNTATDPLADAAVTALLDELESWLRVLEAERAQPSQSQGTPESA